VVEIAAAAFLQRQVGQVAVVGVVLQVGDAASADARQDGLGDGGLAGTAAAGHADGQRAGAGR
jgi:hypothetical protein